MPVAPVERVLAPAPVPTLEASRAAHGAALSFALETDPRRIVDLIATAGLCGRGGAGFPTGRKWRTVHEYAAGAVEPVTVVVNGAEGEPGSFKDRMLMRRDPYRIVEGALVAAHAIGARRVVFALKRTFSTELDRMRDAVRAAEQAGWTGAVELDVFAGPSAYLFGEETGLLEAIDGRPPFPRVAPPFRRGIDEVDLDDRPIAEPDRTAARVELADPSVGTTGTPALVDNVETIAHVADIVAGGPEWFRRFGTADSPGTVVCTVSGDAPRHGVAEFPMGTTLADVLRVVGGVDPADVAAVVPGVSAPWIMPDQLDVPLTYEDLAATGSGLGTAGFIVLARDRDLGRVAAEIARFLAVESCGQCTPCKQDGLRISGALAEYVDGTDADDALRRARDALVTVADSARCNLASQQQRAVGESLDRIAETRSRGDDTADTTSVVAPIADYVDGRFVLDASQATKQPDWSHDATDSGQSPADKFSTEAADAAGPDAIRSGPA
ncbi:MAG: NADH-ubiquinone oxidoreductase-F iron-sulfur binding region domain-containing protein [Acidimicrobiia bacterium]